MAKECKAIDFPVGAYYLNGEDKPLKVIKKRVGRERVLGSNQVDHFVLLNTAQPRPNGEDYLYFCADCILQFQEAIS
jgi:hypothetical protein